MADETTVEAPVVQEETVAAPEPEVVAAEPAAAAEVEVAAQPEKAEPAAAPQAEMSRYQKLVKSLGEIPETPNEQLLESIDEKSIEQLPSSARGLIKHLMSQQNLEHQKRMAEFTEREEALKAHQEKIKEEARTLIRNRAQMNKMLMDPRFQDMLKKADLKEEDMADPITPEGMQQRIEKGVAEAMKEFQRPITAAATRAQQMESYYDFVEKHPQMKTPSFKKEVRQYMEARRDGGSPITLEDAYTHVDRQRLLRAEAARSASEREARAKSARKISRTTVSAQPDAGEPVPNWVTKKGYKGVRGDQARIRYLMDNPKALEKLRAQQKGARRR